jgi:tetratricopeptide (TPR) repeat protein
MARIKDILQEIDRNYQRLDAAEMEAYLLKVRNEYELEHGVENQGYAALANECGSFYRKEGRYAEGEESFLRAADILAQVEGKDSIEYATVLNNLAELYRLSGKRGKAEAILVQTLALFRATVGERHYLYASALNYRGHFQMESGAYQEALEHYEKALGIVEGLPDNAAFLSTAYGNISSALRALGRSREALDFARRFLGASVSAHGENSSSALDAERYLKRLEGETDSGKR